MFSLEKSFNDIVIANSITTVERNILRKLIDFFLFFLKHHRQFLIFSYTGWCRTYLWITLFENVGGMIGCVLCMLMGEEEKIYFMFALDTYPQLCAVSSVSFEIRSRTSYRFCLSFFDFFL